MGFSTGEKIFFNEQTNFFMSSSMPIHQEVDLNTLEKLKKMNYDRSIKYLLILIAISIIK